MTSLEEVIKNIHQQQSMATLTYINSLLDALFADRFFGRNDFSKIFPGQKGQNDNKQEKKMDDLTRPSLSNFDLGGPTSGRLTDTDLLLGKYLLLK